MIDKPELADAADAARLEGKAAGMMWAHDIARACGHEALATQIADLCNEAWAMAARIRRHADDAEVMSVTLH